MEYCGAEKLATASEFADLVKDKYVLRDHNSTFYIDGRANFLRTLSPEFVSQKSNVQHQVNNYQIVDSTGYIPGGYKYNQKLNVALNGNLGKRYCSIMISGALYFESKYFYCSHCSKICQVFS